MKKQSSISQGVFQKACKRKRSFWDSEMPLTSKRARFILSSEIEAEKLVNSIRFLRNPNVNKDGEASFIITDKKVITQFEKF